MANMTDKQKRFCDEYLIDMNGTAAAIRAGYSKKTAGMIASENLKKPYIREYIEKRMAEKEESLIAKQNEVMKYLTAVMRRELVENIVVTVSEEKSWYEAGEDGKMRKRSEKKEIPRIVEIPAQLRDANKAAELLGRAYGMYTEKMDVNGPIPVVISGGDDLED